MSLLGKIAALFSGGAASKVCVVDGDRLAGGDRIGPGERFQALNKLARYAGREEVAIKVVFGGRPLREAGDGDSFNGVDVYYAETAAEVQARIQKILSSTGRGKALLITSDQALESDMRARGYATMRMSTLRKAMEPPLEGGGREGGERFGGRDRGERGDRDGGRRNRSRGRDRDRGPRRPQPEEASGQDGAPPVEGPPPRPQESAPRQQSGADNTVKNLIDLVE